MTALRHSATVVLLLSAFLVPPRSVRAQGPAGPYGTPEATGRVGLEIAGGPAFEVAAAGDRDSQRGVVFVPSVGIRVTSWFDGVIEGHVARHLTPVGGNVLGIVPMGFRLHTPGRTQVHLSAGAGLAWTDLTGVRGIDRRRNYLTQIGAGVARVGRNGSALTVDARLLHLSNLSSAPPNLGMEVFTVLVGYRLPK